MIEGRKTDESLLYCNVIRVWFVLGTSRNKDSICMLCPHKTVRKCHMDIFLCRHTVSMRRRCPEAGLEADTHATASAHSVATHLANFFSCTAWASPPPFVLQQL